MPTSKLSHRPGTIPALARSSGPILGTANSSVRAARGNPARFDRMSLEARASEARTRCWRKGHEEARESRGYERSSEVG